MLVAEFHVDTNLYRAEVDASAARSSLEAVTPYRAISWRRYETIPAKGQTMTEMPREEKPAALAAGRWVKVWDLPTRLFLWLLVGLVVVGVVTGFVTPEWWMGVHLWAGYGLVALMAFRLVWGLCGPEYSRIVSFLYPPRSTVEHLRGLILLRPPHYVGHNPTGALMVFALMGVILTLGEQTCKIPGWT